jgi:hypothetical protein
VILPKYLCMNKPVACEQNSGGFMPGVSQDFTREIVSACWLLLLESQGAETKSSASVTGGLVF